MVLLASTDRLKLAPLADLPEGQSRGFDPLGEGQDSMFVIRRGDRVHAWRNACPHYDRARMAWKKDEYLTADRQHVICGAHGAMFEIDTGECVIGPCLGKTLHPVTIEIIDGTVFVVGPYAPARPPRPQP